MLWTMFILGFSIGGFVVGFVAYKKGYKNAQEKIDYMSIDLC